MDMLQISRWDRREFFRKAGYVAAGMASSQTAFSEPKTDSRNHSSATSKKVNVYEKLGVRPIINCQGTYTILSGSLTLPEVKRVMEEASHYYIHLDELMEKVGERLAELTGADFGIVTSGCAAALAHVTAACVAGADPERMQRLPDLTGLKDEVIMPKASRNMYDHAIRMLGVKIIEVENSQQFQSAVNSRTAMITIMGDKEEKNGVSLEELVEVGKKRGIPVLVDAAAERPDVPNYYLMKGVDAVAYSGGKCLRGPQCSGVVLGKKDLLWAAWLNGAPHHAFGRPMKVGKEEIMGVITAVEMWVKHRDHKAEWKEWESWLATISSEVTKVPRVRTAIVSPGRSNVAPVLSITWDETEKSKAVEVKRALNDGTPRIWVPLGSEGGIAITPYMMEPGEDRIVAKRLREILSTTLA